MTGLVALVASIVIAVLGLLLLVLVIASLIRDHRHTPCCPTCQGTGISGDIETNGRCWDCRGTGHPHG